MSQYIIKYTDPLKTSFNVQPYTTNGRTNPSLAPLDPNAVTSSSSLLIYGKGMPEYGQNVQNNMLHLLENFASPASDPPLDQTEGQLWYNNTALELKIWEPAGPTPTLWSSVLLDTGTAPMRADFDLNNNRILNVPTVPTAVTDAVNEQYVLNHEADTALHLSIEQNDLLDDLETLYTATANLADLADQLIALENFDVAAGRTVEIALALKADKVTTVGPLLDRIAILDNLGNLVDSGIDINTVGGAGHTHTATQTDFTPSGTISGASTNVQLAIEELDSEVYTELGLRAPIANPIFTGIVSATGNINAAGNISVTGTGRMFVVGDPTTGLEVANRQYVLDEISGSIGGAVDPNEGSVFRKVVIADGTSSIYFPPKYTIGNNKFQVYVNGQKYYANVRGHQEVFVADSGVTGLANDATVYTFNITVDGGGPQLMSVTGSTAQTFEDLVSQITINPLVGATVRSTGSGVLNFISDNQNSPGTSTIAITDVDLFSSLVSNTFAITEANIGSNFFRVDQNYIHLLQVGATFNVVGSTGNDGGSPYTVVTSTYDNATDSTIINVASVVDATADGDVVFAAVIQPAVTGSTQGYLEIGLHGSSSAAMQFNATIPTVGQMIEFLVYN